MRRCACTSNRRASIGITSPSTVAAVARSGLSQQQLAKRLGTSQSTVNGWISGRNVPAGDFLLRLPELLGISGHWLLTGEEPIEPPLATGRDAEWIRYEAIAQDLRRRVLAAVEAALATESPRVMRVAERAVADVEYAERAKAAQGQRQKRARRAGGGSG